jgi:hypothetical protein
MTASKTINMNLPDQYSNPLLQAGAAIVCWILAFHVPAKVYLSVPVLDMLDIILALILKVFGAVATGTTVLSFWFKNETRIKRRWRKFRGK